MPKPGYKMTELGELPAEWEIVEIKEIGDVKGGKRIPKGEKFAEGRTPYPYIRVVDMKNGSVDTSNLMYLRPETYEKIKRYTISSNDVYITIAGTIGLAGTIPKSLDGANLTENAAKITNLKNIDKKFLAFVLNSPLAQNQIKAYTGKATQPKLALFRIEKIKIPLPPLPEQRRIAKVLSTVDEAIEKTDEMIAHADKLKKGLMQILLTKGIGHERFKDTDIGRIPEEWEVVRLNKIAHLDSGGTPSRQKPEYWKNGHIPWLKSGELNDGIIYKTEEKITDLGLKNSSAKIFPRGTLLIALYGATVGKTGILGIDSSTNQAICAILPRNKNAFDSQFLKYAIIFHRHRLISQSSGGAQPNIYLYVLKNFRLPLPPLEEQKKIAEILGTVDRKLELLRARRERLEKVKKGLMNDLLTGRKRVPEGVV